MLLAISKITLVELAYESGNVAGYPVSDVFFSAFIAVATEMSAFFNSVAAVRDRQVLNPNMLIVARIAIITTTIMSSTIVKPLVLRSDDIPPVYIKH